MGGHPEQQRGRGLWFTGRKRAGNQDAPGGQRPSRGRQARMATIAGCGAAAIALVVGACGSSGSSSSSGGTKEAGGVATYALPPSTTPNYIFPMSNSTYFSVSNISYLQAYLYRPLYWFGNGTQPTLNPSISLADQPVYNGKQVTITLKNYKWSDGTPVTAQNILFWINMLQAVGQTEWGAFVPGGFPTNVTNVKATSATTLTMTMNKAYSPTWFTYNELSQITPMPKAWDRTASGPSNCTTTVSDCKAVYTYLDSQSKSMSTYASSPVWSVVDGPWKLSSFNADGNATFVPNKSYSGPVKPTLAQFKEVPFTTEAAEYNVLRSGSGSQKLSFGYLPTTDAPKKPANATVGANPVPGYSLDPLYTWGINYFVPNIDSTNPEGQVIKQLYFRQALASLVNQEAVIAGPLRGYGNDDDRAGRLQPGDQLPVPPGQDRPVPLRPGQGQVAAVQPRLERRAQRDHHLHQPEPVRRGRQAGPGPVVHPAVRDGHLLDRVGDDPAQVERLAGRHPAAAAAEAVQPGHRDRRRRLRRHQVVLRLGLRQLGRWLDLRARLLPQR